MDRCGWLVALAGGIHCLRSVNIKTIQVMLGCLILSKLAGLADLVTAAMFAVLLGVGGIEQIPVR